MPLIDLDAAVAALRNTAKTPQDLLLAEYAIRTTSRRGCGGWNCWGRQGPKITIVDATRETRSRPPMRFLSIPGSGSSPALGYRAKPEEVASSWMGRPPKQSGRQAFSGDSLDLEDL